MSDQGAFEAPDGPPRRSAGDRLRDHVAHTRATMPSFATLAIGALVGTALVVEAALLINVFLLR